MSGFRTFVIMPFGSNHEYEGGANESEYVYKEIIYPAVRSVVGDDEFQPESLVCESNRHQPGSITASMIRDIVKADVVIADITGQNPNVFMELGIRFALRDKITIIIAQEGTIVPFDRFKNPPQATRLKPQWLGGFLVRFQPAEMAGTVDR